MQEDAYFKELVRYIHLNPLRAGLLKYFQRLNGYPWSDHSAIMGRTNRKWQDVDYVLSWFGTGVSTARRAYAEYVEEGISLGRRPELVGGGLIRSLGGCSKVLSMRRPGEKRFADERILGSSDFVESLLKEADEQMKARFSVRDVEKKADRLIRKFCRT